MSPSIAAFAALLSLSVAAGNAWGQVRYAVNDLGELGNSTGSKAYGINAGGDVVGSGHFGGHAFLYSKGKMTDLGTLGGATSIANGINDNGQVVGWSDTPGNAHRRAFLYSGGKTTDLNNLIAPASGWTLEEAAAINDQGQIAGSGTNPQGRGRAFLLTPTR
jgi:probable HAF family extracellular repeat protein